MSGLVNAVVSMGNTGDGILVGKASGLAEVEVKRFVGDHCRCSVEKDGEVER